MYQKVNQQLQQIKLAMIKLELWSVDEPSVEKLASQMPFAYDTLTLEQWLQFIFIPKMTELVLHHEPLPTNFAVTPMAEQVWIGQVERQPLINAIRQLDELLSDR